MYREYLLNELINETMKKVVEPLYSNESDRMLIEMMRNTDARRGEFTSSLQITEEDNSESDLSDDVFLLEGGAMARAHWIQLHKLNLQTPLVQSALLYIVENYKHVRPIWQFGLKIDETSPEWKTILYNDFYFRHHSASIQSAITMVMGSLDDRECMRKLLNEVGAHHYFYDACEAHLELFEHAMLHTLRTSLAGDSKMDAATEQSWVEFLKDVKTYIGEGIAIQRNTYLRECMTPNEMIDIRSKWEKIIDFGLPEAGEIVCERAIKSYTMLIGMHRMEMMIPFKRSSEVFTSFAEMVMQAFDIAIQSYSHGVGFCNLVTDIREFVVKCMILDTCPSLARKAILEGLFEMLQRVCGDSELKECARRKWNKLYRALEQAIIASIMEY